LTSQQDALTHTTTNAFNNLNRQTSNTTPLGKATSWEYDGNGNITKRTDGKNNITTYQYDSLNRLKKITYPNASTITYSYDNRGNLTTMVDPNGTSTYVYDSFDRMTKATNSFGQVIQYAYDNAGNLTSLTYPGSKAVTYTYDNDNRMSTVKDWNNKTTTYTYNDNGTVATRAYPNSVTTYYTYDAANRLITIDHKYSTRTLAKYEYTRDLVGNIKIATESGDLYGTADVNTFNYDDNSRVTSATYAYPSYTYSYTYDKVGNRLTKSDGFTTTTYTYNNDNQLATIDGHSNTYDNNGNLTSVYDTPSHPKTYTYDYENHLTKNTESLNSDTYKYDGLGNRYEYTDNASMPTRYITDVSQSLPRTLADYSVIYSEIENWYIYGLGPIAEFDGSSDDLDVNYYIEDGMGNVRTTTDSGGSSSTTLSYDPFGVRTYQSGGNPVNEFDAQRVDTDTNFYYLRARYYDPDTGRFLTRDPLPGNLQNPLTQNAYTYAGDNPINHDDPSGRCYWDLCIGESIIAGAIISTEAPALITAIDEIGHDLQKSQYGDAINIAMLFLPMGSLDELGVNMTNHALLRIAERNITLKQVEETILNGDTFKYFHEGEWKQGYYNPKTKLFIGSVGNRITTIIDNVKQKYIDNLLKNSQ
jgi:RHS repeat-associated protein